jgi:hypothetical protein
MMQSLGDLPFCDAYALSLDTPKLIEKLQQVGVLHKSMECIKCSTLMKIGVYQKRTDGFSWVCSAKGCKTRQSIRKNSYFEKHLLPLTKLFMILYCHLKYDKMLLKDMSDICGVDKGTMSNWANFIRETISHYYIVNPQQLGGVHAVQIDESMFGGRRKYNLGNHQVHAQGWVFGIVEEVTNRNVLWMVEDRKRQTLFQIIEAHVIKGSTIKSDEWASYRTINELGYNHLLVNHSLNFVRKDGTHTQLIESLWSNVKSVLKLKRGTSKELLPGYLDLYSFICDARYRLVSPIDYFFDLIQVGKFY